MYDYHTAWGTYRFPMVVGCRQLLDVSYLFKLPIQDFNIDLRENKTLLSSR